MRLQDKVALIVGAGQSPGEGIGNGRATAMLFAREGAKIAALDRELALAEGMVELSTAGLNQAIAGRTTVEEVFYKISGQGP